MRNGNADASIETFEVETRRGLARVHLHASDSSPNGLLVLGHGAGGGVGSKDLVAATVAGMAAGFAVALVEQPYRVLGRKAPPPIAHAGEAWEDVVLRLRADHPDLPVVVGGRSFGGRVACRTSEAVGAAAVLCLAFPLVAPSGADRAPELDGVRVPVLVIQGKKDPFGMPRERGDRRVVVVEGTHTLDRETPVIEREIGAWLADRTADLASRKEVG